MNKIFHCIALLIAVCLAGSLAAPGAVLYTSPSEYPLASGYEYQHTVQTPDYVQHSSVSAPLNGFANVPSVVRTVYNHPLTYAQW